MQGRVASLGLAALLASCSSENPDPMTPVMVATGGMPATGGAPVPPPPPPPPDAGRPDVSSSTTPSCVGLLSTCSPTGRADCCASSVVPGGSFNRGNDPAFPATVSAFRLDTYEVTVGRFRKFIAAYSQTMLVAGAGKNPNNPEDPGWDVAWNADLPVDAAALLSAFPCDSGPPAWTDEPGANENLPINCLSWWEAFAFCAWDEGRLPTEAEWNYAAAGGSEQRFYPWGEAEPDCSYANFGREGVWPDTACVQSGANGVGSESPKGDGRWGHADLAGNVAEYMLDWYADPYPQVPCVDCATLTPGELRVNRGGNFLFIAEALSTPDRRRGPPTNQGSPTGVRCARDP